VSPGDQNAAGIYYFLIRKGLASKSVAPMHLFQMNWMPEYPLRGKDRLVALIHSTLYSPNLLFDV
jgi:hypothetical protein